MPVMSSILSLNPERISLMRLRAVVIALVFVLCWVALSVFPGVQQKIEFIWQDLIWSASVKSDANAAPVIIAIDENSLQEVGAWPWPRDTLAELSDRLQERQVANQLFDIVFPEPKAGDDRLIAALIENNAIIGQIPYANGEEASRKGTLTGALAALRCGAGVGVAAGYLGNTAGFSEVEKGHITPLVGADGVIRSAPALLCVDGLVYPSISLVGYLSQFSEGVSLSLTQPEGVLAPARSLEIKSTEESPHVIPLGMGGEILVDYRLNSDAFTVYSASDLLAGRIPDGLLKGKTVIVGATAFGLGDMVPTPHQALTPGVMIQANLLESLLNGSSLHEAQSNMLLIGLLVVLAAVVMVSAPGRSNRRSSVVLYPALAIALPVLLFALELVLLQTESLVTHLGGLSLSLSFTALALGVLEHRVSFQRGSHLVATLRAYLPGSVAESATHTLPKGYVDAERQFRVLLSADIRNFSAFEEARPPEETAALLHLFLTEATSVVERQAGYVEELKGDSLLVSWPENIAPEQALQAAKELHLRITGILAQSGVDEGHPLALGVAIDAGSVLVGSIGSQSRRVHTLLGDTVTRVIRLQEMTEELAQPILIGSGFTEHYGTDMLRDMGSYLLPGLRKPRRIYALSDKVEDSWEQFGSHLKVLKGGK